jgi:hypothetical protein
VSNERETKGHAMRLPARVKTLVMVGVLGALITVVSGATLEAMQRPEAPSAASQLTSSSAGVVVAAEPANPPRRVAPETLYLLLLGAMLLCVAAGVSAVSSGDSTGARAGERGAGSIEPAAVIHAASAASSTR